MSSGLKKATPDGCENSLSPQVQQGKVPFLDCLCVYVFSNECIVLPHDKTWILQIDEVRRLIGPQSGKLALYCSDASILRYLRARNWNVKKAVKMLKASLKWRLEYKPEEIRWDDVAVEAETGKIYRSSYKDKYGRSVLVMRPRCQNSKSIKGQIKYLVYCMENAILNLPQDQEQMVWLIDFHGFNMSHISIKVTRETAHVLQEHYPERLGVAILYDAPKIFEPFWMVAKPFLEPKTANKVKFAYSGDPNSKKIMDDLFDMALVESAFGGKDEDDFDITKYAERMREDDKKIPLIWKMDDFPTTTPSPPSLIIVHNSNSEQDSDKSSVGLENPKSHGEKDVI
ncbi:random slug protein 5 [Phtheirospermum japonicum]|uniref:Random slug protein 5 n=1 Tax=Phtheirospermum japonicum TaxID=374723 RepID=A0A830DFH5_9LAMI|nr:random slug protein 5 [Phtheirospermum japonicum]